MEYTEVVSTSPKKVFSRLGFALAALLIVVLVAQVLWVLGPSWILGPDNVLDNSSTWMWLGNMIPLYAIAVPVFLLILRPVRADTPVKKKVPAIRMISVILICFFFMYTGNILGNVLSALFSGGAAENRIVEMTTDSNPLRIIYMVLLGPVLEELVFRKIIIDRTWQYGEKTAVILSALVFALFHQNLFQLFYTFGIGILFGYLYVRSGKLRIPAILHICFNSIGAIIAPAMLKITESELLTNPSLLEPGRYILAAFLSMVLLGFVAVLFGLYISGLVMFCVRFTKSQWLPAPKQIPKDQVIKTVYRNVGMIAFIVLGTALTIIALFI